MPGDGHQYGDVLQVAVEIRWHGHVDDGADDGARGGEPSAAQDVNGREAQGRGGGGGACKKMVRPSHRREMALIADAETGLSVTLACKAFGISECCYRYRSKLQPENELIANWLVRLTDNHRNWGFGLCLLNLRNVRGQGWNHKRVYRIYRELELNLRICPKRRMVRERP